MLKNNKGITLIALVITIIVLLILAGVSIAMLTGENGILTQAENAKTDTSDAEIADRINMALNGEFTNLLAEGHLSRPTASTAFGDADTILSANGLKGTDVTYTVSTIGTTGTEAIVLTIKATGSEGEISGSITYDSTEERYEIDSAEYPQ